MGLYIGLGIGLLLATCVVHWVVWKFLLKPRLDKHAKMIQEQSQQQES
ncbi:hypothetical protein [Pelistega suis]|uniref:Uncharacterized protein n=1 Tax=Pelistega suis TaxID=1631957 RepID=A0A849P526_9BURK|nr:hypothetical protein [Pelistega suis]MCQ9328116.1 hypothetical protein [Pelistega suis]NOL50902.1 hypothetical protein [Pelistega suis]